MGRDILLKKVGQAFASLASSLTALIEREELEANQNLHELEANQELHAKQQLEAGFCKSAVRGKSAE
eukprot:c25315_g2_i2 orf=2-199(-)